LAETAILALGGNALIREDQRGTLEEQYTNALAMAHSVRSLIRKGWNVVIVHGNGPQVGNLAIQHEGSTDLVPALPLFTLGAMTQGQLGSLICLALNEVCKREITGAVSVITHVEVDPGDPAAPLRPPGRRRRVRGASRQAPGAVRPAAAGRRHPGGGPPETVAPGVRTAAERRAAAADPVGPADGRGGRTLLPIAGRAP